MYRGVSPEVLSGTLEKHSGQFGNNARKQLDLPGIGAYQQSVDQHTRKGVRSIVVHAGWRTGPDVALAVARSVLHRARTPEPIRLARQLAGRARTASVTPP
jgi:deoxyinosine 3'endonuclease (endonuclease V)